MSARLPHANDFEIPDCEFIAAWQAAGELLGPDGWNWETDAMPRCHRRECLVDMLQKGLRFAASVAGVNSLLISFAMSRKALEALAPSVLRREEFVARALKQATLFRQGNGRLKPLADVATGPTGCGHAALHQAPDPRAAA